jgi:hypothetical protein
LADTSASTLTITEIYTFGTLPWIGYTDSEVIMNIRKGQKMNKPMGCPDAVYSVMCNCWAVHAERRASAETVDAMLMHIRDGQTEESALGEDVSSAFEGVPVLDGMSVNVTDCD